MSEPVCYIPSFNDSQLVADSLSTCGDWEVVISDNASDEPHRGALAALAGGRVRVIRQEKPLGRVGNWRFCATHFLASGRDWMKYLSAGDRHLPGARQVFLGAIRRHPHVRCIMPQMDNVWPHRTIRWAPTDAEEVLPCPHLMAATAQFGNIYHGLSAPLFHREALSGGVHFGEEVLSFCADLLFMIEIARRTPILYLLEVTAEFMALRRKNLQANMWTLEHFLEEGLMRYRAAEAYRELTGDAARYQQLQGAVVAFLREGLAHPADKLTGEAFYPPEVLCGDVPARGATLLRTR